MRGGHGGRGRILGRERVRLSLPQHILLVSLFVSVLKGAVGKAGRWGEEREYLSHAMLAQA